MASSFLSQHDSLLLLERYLPTIFSLITEKTKYKSNIISSYEKKYDQLVQEIEIKREYRGQSTIFDLLWEANEGIPSKKKFLLFIDNLVSKILSNIDDAKISQVRKICYRMITNFNQKESQYTRCLAELCVLEKIVTSKKFTLVQIEKKIENGRPFDFQFKSDNKKTYVEVYNVDFDAQKIESEESLRKFLTNRLEVKINSKIQGITIEKVDFLFITVLWGDIKQLEKYTNLFESFKEFRFLSPFMMISEYVSPKKEYVYTFEPVTTFLRRNKEIEERKEVNQ